MNKKEKLEISKIKKDIIDLRKLVNIFGDCIKIIADGLDCSGKTYKK